MLFDDAGHLVWGAHVAAVALAGQGHALGSRQYLGQGVESLAQVWRAGFAAEQHGGGF